MHFSDCVQNVLSDSNRREGGGFSGGASGEEPPARAGDAGDADPQIQPLLRGDPLEEGMAPTPVLLPGEPCGRRSLLGCRPWGRTEPDTTEAT